MATALSTKAVEKSTYIISAAFTDENDNAVTPQTVVWSLTDGDGVVINSREDVSCTAASTVSIVLTGSDLQVNASRCIEEERYLTVKATYNSATYGNGLYLKKAAKFNVENLFAVV